VKVSIPQDGVARINVDPKTRIVHVASIAGSIVVTSTDGKVVMLAQGESTDTNASIEGEIQTFGEAEGPVFSEAEEPAEPERPEASPHLP
jgi:hypothetical protein